MIAAELRGGNKPSLNEALSWIGSRVDDIYGAGVGRLEDVWIDPGSGVPRWLLVKEGRFGGRTTLIPFEDATAGAGHVWIPYERDVVREAPEVEPGAPLTQQLEASLRHHYASNTAPAAAEPRPGEQHAPAAMSGAAGAASHGHAAQRSADAPIAYPAPPQPHHPAPAPQQATGRRPVQQPPSAQHPPAYSPIEAGSPDALGRHLPQQPAPRTGARPPRPAPAAPASHLRSAGPSPLQSEPAPATQRRQSEPPASPGPHEPRRPLAARPQPQPTVMRSPAVRPDPYRWEAGSDGPQSHVQAVPPPSAEPAPQAPPVSRPEPPRAPDPAAEPSQYQPEQHSVEPEADASGPASEGDRVEEAERPVAVPVIHGLDRPYRVEIELGGDLKISGELKGFSLTPIDDRDH